MRLREKNVVTAKTVFQLFSNINSETSSYEKLYASFCMTSNFKSNRQTKKNLENMIIGIKLWLQESSVKYMWFHEKIYMDLS